MSYKMRRMATDSKRAGTRRKGPVVKLEQIDRLTARIKRAQRALEDAPHPHAQESRPGVATILNVCPRGCPVEARQLALYKRQMRLDKLQRAVLIELARARAKARRKGAEVTREMYEQAREIAASSKHPRRKLAEQLLLSREGLRKLEEKNPTWKRAPRKR